MIASSLSLPQTTPQLVHHHLVLHEGDMLSVFHAAGGQASMVLNLHALTIQMLAVGH